MVTKILIILVLIIFFMLIAGITYALDLITKEIEHHEH